MSLTLRRVVTGHDDEGRADVLFDGPMENVLSRRPGHSSSVVWVTDQFPADNSGNDDTSRLTVGTALPSGVVCRVVQYDPGVSGRVHRTDSVDYAVVMSGSIDMELECGRSVHLDAGDVLIQRGTAHNWVNRGSEACRILFVLVAAHPVRVGGEELNAFG